MGRRNPRQSVDSGQTSHDFRIDEWTIPGGGVTAFSGQWTAAPDSQACGFDVRDWLDVFLFLSPNPKYQDTQTLSAADVIQIRPWRFYSKARGAGVDQGGQWVADVVRQLTCYNTAATPGVPRQYEVFETLSCDKIYFQIVAYAEAGAAYSSPTSDLILGALYGRSPRIIDGQAILARNSCECTPGSQLQSASEHVIVDSGSVDAVVQGKETLFTQLAIDLNPNTVMTWPVDLSDLTAVGVVTQLSVQLYITAGSASTVTVTFMGGLLSADVDVTKAGYRLDDNSLGNASYVIPAGGTLTLLVDYDEIRFKAFAAVMTTSNSGGSAGSFAGRIAVRTL